MVSKRSEVEVPTYDLEVQVNATQHPVVVLELSPGSDVHVVNELFQLFHAFGG
jgi:hypothetical protein